MLILVSNNSFINSIEKISTEKVISAIENNNYSCLLYTSDAADE